MSWPAALGRRPSHSAGAPRDCDGQWHVGHGHPGHFPMVEATCPCPKAPCGLAAPVNDIDCREHWGDTTIRQYHRDEDCPNRKRS